MKTQEKQELVSFWKDKRVLITGGTKGLGKELTKSLVQLGSIVTIVARTEKDLKEMQKLSAKIYIIQADLSDKEEIHKISGQATGMMPRCW